MQFEEIDLTAIEDKIKEEKAQEEGYVETPTESARLPPDPPFAHLEKLDLSYNQVRPTSMQCVQCLKRMILIEVIKLAP